VADTEADLSRGQATVFGAAEPVSAGAEPAPGLAQAQASPAEAPAEPDPAGVAAGPDPAEVPARAAPARPQPAAGIIHHIELWVPDLDRAIVSWGWLLTALGYRLYQDWPGGRSWGAGHTYIVVEQSPARTAGRHDRCRPGVNHLAFFAADRPHVDELVAEGLLHGWKLMFTDLHPYAGGEHHYAAYLENADGYEVEIVAGC